MDSLSGNGSMVGLRSTWTIIAALLTLLGSRGAASAPASVPASGPASVPASSAASPAPAADLDLPAVSRPASKANPKAKAPKAKAPKARGEADYDLGKDTVYGERRAEATSAGEYRIELGKLHVIPRRNASDHLMLAPGVLTINHGGEGHAQATYMRGFAAREGADIEFLVDGIPLNEPSNAHNHGYADLYFMPPEFVQTVTITEGPYDPEQGDFAFAGSANYRLGVSERGARLRYGFGRFGAQRLLFTYAPKGAEEQTFAGFELYTSSGFGQNRAAQRAAALGRYADDEGPGGLRWAASIYGYATRYDSAGVLRQGDLDAGKVDFFESYDSNQGGESNRVLLSFDLAVGPQDRRFSMVSWFGLRQMRIRANFTGWYADQPFDAAGNRIVQRGDGFELVTRSLTVGSRGTYGLSRELFGQRQQLDLGYALRYDRATNSQRTLRSVTAIPYATVFDNEVDLLNIAGFVRAQLRPLPWLTLRGGVRVDAFTFGVRDLNQPDADREGVREPEQRAQAFGFAINPRVTLDAKVWHELHAIVSYGQGTRSADAASLSDNETAPFARAQVFDLGLSHGYGKAGKGLSLRTQASYSYAYVDKDRQFDPAAGRNIVYGASSRHALSFGVRLGYDGWLDALANVGYAYAVWESVSLPGTSGINVARAGDLIAYIPQLIGRLDLAASGRLHKGWRLGGVPVTGRVGLGLTVMPGRPLPLGAIGDPFYLVNLGGELRLWHVSLGVELRNLLDRRYRLDEFNYASNFVSPEATRSRVPTRHFAAGEPFFVMGTLTVHLESLFFGIAATKPKGAAAKKT
ncbi:MAG: TonB-dependent receptor [Proteobacteria bacterium]|nr:MAG: TonB-dependent receptor [Pseudomonadota bacterium]